MIQERSIDCTDGSYDRDGDCKEKRNAISEDDCSDISSSGLPVGDDDELESSPRSQYSSPIRRSSVSETESENNTATNLTSSKSQKLEAAAMCSSSSDSENDSVSSSIPPSQSRSDSEPGSQSQKSSQSLRSTSQSKMESQFRSRFISSPSRRSDSASCLDVSHESQDVSSTVIESPLKTKGDPGDDADNNEMSSGTEEEENQLVDSEDSEEEQVKPRKIKKKKVESDSDIEGEGEKTKGFEEFDATNASGSGAANTETLRFGDRTLSDFDLMLQAKRDERRKRKNNCLNLDNSERAERMLRDMKHAAAEDRKLKARGEPAINKLRLLPQVMSQLKKHDIRDIFLEKDLLSVLAEWLAPLADKSLPALMIRENFLKLLYEFPDFHPQSLKESGIGKAVMFLYKHPKEIKENKSLAKKLIQRWSRAIFGEPANYTGLSREERLQRDMEEMCSGHAAFRRQEERGLLVPDDARARDPNSTEWQGHNWYDHSLNFL